MRENNASATSDLGKEERVNTSKIMTSDSKSYKESCSIVKISEHRKQDDQVKLLSLPRAIDYLDACAILSSSFFFFTDGADASLFAASIR